MTNANPFAQRSTLEYELPPFAQIKEEHYLPAFYEGCAEQLAEVQAILDTPGAATFENTIVALEKSGQYLGRMLRVFYNKSSSDTNDALDTIGHADRDGGHVATSSNHCHARDNEELELGVRCIAAGIRDDSGRLVAGLSISAPADRIDENWVPKLRSTAADISAALGCPKIPTPSPSSAAR